MSPTVQLVEYRTSERARMAVHGVHTCKSPLCSLCAPKWQRTRSDEISRAIDTHDPERVFFVTLTMRHHAKMALSLQHRLLTQAFGNLWSGSGGAKAAALLGGKPEAIRAHDRTWSNARGWHPHIHALLFVDDAELASAELASMLDVRWPKVLAGALKRFKRLCDRIITKSGCGRDDCPVCALQRAGPRQEIAFIGPVRELDARPVWRERLTPFPLPPKEQIGECPHFRERAERLFGVRLIPRQRRRNDGTTEPVSLHDSVLRVLAMLAAFTPENIQPTRAHGAFVERVRDAARLPKYLAKMGLELASSLSKLGSEGTDGIMHFGLWEVARLACAHGHPLRGAARKAWRDLFRATFGTQTITFSDREALGLPEDPYAEGAEPPEADPGSPDRPAETTSVIGEIQSTVYRALATEREHGLLSELHGAYGRGELGALAYVEAPGEAGRPLQRLPSSRGPPSTADPCALGVDGYLVQRPDGSRGEVPSVAERLAEVEAGASTIVGDGYRKATELPSSGPSFVEQIRKRLAELIGR